MGTFRVAIGLAADAEGPFEDIEALVDTGATYTLAPAPLLGRMGVEPTLRRRFALADGSSAEWDMGVAHVRLRGETLPTPVVFGGEGVEPLLGAVTLEEFGLGVDPVARELVPVVAYLAGFRRPERR